MAHKYSWLVQTTDYGLVQVDGDRANVTLGSSASFHTQNKDGTEYMLCSFAPGKWTSIEVMSQISGYGNGFTRIEDNKAKGRGKK